MDKLNRIIESYPPELKLLLVFCGSERWEVAELLPVVEWDKFIAWVKRHRVTPAVYRYIKKNPAEVPEVVANKIEQRYKKVTQKNMLLLSETVKICSNLSEAGISAVPIKGVILSYQLYGDFISREVRDIDLLIDQERLTESIAFLEKKGYYIESKISKNKKKIKNTFYPIVLKNLENYVSIELHRRLLPWEGIGSDLTETFLNNKEFVEAGLYSLRVPPPEQHSIFCILHGMKHLWSSLQWVNDIIYLKKTSEKEIIKYEYLNNASEKVYSSLYNKENKSKEHTYTREFWERKCLSTIKTLNEKKLKTISYKLLYIKLALWMNNNQRSFKSRYLCEFIQRYFP